MAFRDEMIDTDIKISKGPTIDFVNCADVNKDHIAKAPESATSIMKANMSCYAANEF